MCIDGVYDTHTYNIKHNTFSNTKRTTKKCSDDSEWTVRNDVLMACNSRGFDDLSSRVTDYGKLYAGLCAGEPPKTYDQIGPELGFGWSVGDAFNNGKSDTGGEDNDDKILLLKVAWGGKSLAVDFRPPSSGARRVQII